MVRLTDDQVDYILDDIKANGVVLEDLQHNLLDHICCIIENEMTDSDNFYKFYESVLPRFFKKELKEIQVETENLLTFKNYYAMKNTLKISGLVAALLTIAGATFKTFHLPGAAIMIVLGAGLFSLIFLPLMIVLKFKDEEKTVDKWVFSFGFLIAIAISTGVLFKIMHWPLANILMRSGLTAFVFFYVPLYYFTRIRRVELKFNTTVNSVLMMACGGLLYGLYNLGYSKKIEDSFYANYEFTIQQNELLRKSVEAKMLQVSNDSILEIKKISEELINKMDDIKASLLAQIDDVSIKKARNMKLKEIIHNNDYDFVQKLFVHASDENSYKELKMKFDVYNAILEKFYQNSSDFKINYKILSLENCTISVLIQSFATLQNKILNNMNYLL